MKKGKKSTRYTLSKMAYKYKNTRCDQDFASKVIYIHNHGQNKITYHNYMYAVNNI